MLDTQEAGGSIPLSRTMEVPHCKKCGTIVEPYKDKDGGRVEGVYWHTMYHRLRIKGCDWARSLLRFDPSDLENSMVEFK